VPAAPRVGGGRAGAMQESFRVWCLSDLQSFAGRGTVEPRSGLPVLQASCGGA